MIVRIDEIQIPYSEFKLRFNPSEFDILSEGVTIHVPVQAEVLLKRVGLDIEVSGRLDFELQVECSRCLEPQSVPFQKDFYAIYRDVTWRETKEEVELGGEDLLVSYYSEDILNLQDIIREQILLSIPIQFFCKTDCAGLCPQCGQNLNIKKCSCKADKIDPRLAVLGKLLQN
jgi:uncharacterized protein